MERIARIQDARQRVQTLAPQTVEDLPQVVPLDVDAWADRWRLHALRDLAPYIRAHWHKRPVAGARFEFLPRILPLRSRTFVDIEIDLDRDSKNAFLARAEALYEERVRVLPIRPYHRRRQLRRHAEWFVRARVQGWTVDQIAQEATTANHTTDPSTIRKAVTEFARLLSTTGN